MNERETPKTIHSREQLSKEAQSLVRRLLRGDQPGFRGRCPPEDVAWECTMAGLLVQVETPPDEGKEMSPLFPKGFRKRAKELGFPEAT